MSMRGPISRALAAGPLFFLASAASAAAAVPPSTDPASVTETVPPVREPADGKREVPDYDGRPAAPPTAREGFIWIPRALLLPAHLTVEYLLRRPVVGFVRWGEEHHVFKRIYDLFTWDEGQSGVYPIASLDLGIKSTVGLALVDRRFFVPGNSQRHLAFSGCAIRSG